MVVRAPRRANYATVHPRGQITLPKQLREETGLEAGVPVTFRKSGPNSIEIIAQPRRSLMELIHRYQVDQPIGDFEALVREAEAEQADNFR